LHLRAYRDDDWAEWLGMSRALFPDESTEELSSGMRAMRSRDDYEFFVLERSHGMGRIVQYRKSLNGPPTT
jgi:hypothetical protein